MSFLWLTLRENRDYFDLLRKRLTVETFYILVGFFFSTTAVFPWFDLIVFISFFIDFEGESTFIEGLRPKTSGELPLIESFFLDIEGYLVFFVSIEGFFFWLALLLAYLILVFYGYLLSMSE